MRFFKHGLLPNEVADRAPAANLGQHSWRPCLVSSSDTYIFGVRVLVMIYKTDWIAAGVAAERGRGGANARARSKLLEAAAHSTHFVRASLASKELYK
jgi:hypothetical protein